MTTRSWRTRLRVCSRKWTSEKTKWRHSIDRSRTRRRYSGLSLLAGVRGGRVFVCPFWSICRKLGVCPLLGISVGQLLSVRHDSFKANRLSLCRCNVVVKGIREGRGCCCFILYVCSIDESWHDAVQITSMGYIAFLCMGLDLYRTVSSMKKKMRLTSLHRLQEHYAHRCLGRTQSAPNSSLEQLYTYLPRAIVYSRIYWGVIHN